MTLLAGTIGGSANNRDGQGELIELSETGLAGVAQTFVTVPANSVIYFNAMRAVLSTDATNTVNRMVSLIVLNTLFSKVVELPWAAFQSALTIKEYNWALGVDSEYDAVPSGVAIDFGRNPMPANLYLPSGWSIGVQVYNIEAADIISNLNLIGQLYVVS